MSQLDPHDPKRAHWTVTSVALVVIGLLILIPAGLCTALLGGSILLSSISMGDWSGIFAVLIYGGVPLGFGIAILIAGFKTRPRR